MFLSLDPEFHELFFHTFNNIQNNSVVVFEVWSAKHLGKDSFCGQASVELIRLMPDGLHDFELTLVPRPKEAGTPRRSSLTNKLSLRGNSQELISGTLHVRMVMSNLSGHRARAGPSMLNYEYFYDNVAFKTGDVIAYGGVGMLPSLTKLVSNSEYSTLGLILCLPNLYTQRLEYFVVEVTPNNDNMIDAFAERPKKAVCIFRLFERLHQFHGSHILHYPLKEAVSEAGGQKMMSWIRQVHSRGGLSLDLQAVQIQFIKRELGFKIEKPEIQAELSELSSSLFVARCLALAGQIPPETLSMINGLPSFVVCLPCFSKPNLVRQWNPSEAEILSPNPYQVVSVMANGSLSPPAQRPDSPLPNLARSSSLHATVLKRSQNLSHKSLVSELEEEPLEHKAMPTIQRQISTLNYQPDISNAAGDADLLAVDVDALISDLRHVNFEGWGDEELGNEGAGSDNVEDDEEDERDDEDDSDRSDGRVVSSSTYDDVESPEFNDDGIMNLDMDVATLDLGNIDLSLLEAVAPSMLLMSDPLAQNVLNLVNYLPGMELVRFSAGALTIDEASSLIRYKHEVLGGCFWTYDEFQGAVSNLGLSMSFFDSFGSKAPFSPAVLRLLAPQTARQVKCEAIFDQAAISASLIDVISTAKSFVHFCAPLLTHQGIIRALTQAVSNGCEVRVLVGGGHCPIIPGAEIVNFDSTGFLENWTPEYKKMLAKAGVPSEFLEIQSMSRRSLNGRSFPVCLRRSLVCVDGVQSTIGSFDGSADDKHDCIILMTGISSAKLVHEAFISLWFCVGGILFDYLAERYNAREEIIPVSELVDEVALYLSFPGNPCNLLQKHVLESLGFSKGLMLIESPHLTETAIHGQLKSLPRSRLRQVRILTGANPETLSGRLLRSYDGSVLKSGLTLVDYSVKTPHCSLIVATDCVFCGSYSFTHRPDLDAGVLVRGGSRIGAQVASQIAEDIKKSQLMQPTDMNLKSGSVKVTESDMFQ